jgi:hypothetical protein
MMRRLVHGVHGPSMARRALSLDISDDDAVGKALKALEKEEGGKEEEVQDRRDGGEKSEKKLRGVGEGSSVQREEGTRRGGGAGYPGEEGRTHLGSIPSTKDLLAAARGGGATTRVSCSMKSRAVGAAEEGGRGGAPRGGNPSGWAAGATPLLPPPLPSMLAPAPSINQRVAQVRI